MTEEVKSPSLSIDDMLDAADIQYVTVPVPEWGGEVRLGSISAGDMLDEIEATQAKGDRESTIRLVVRSVVDADGARIPPESVEAFVAKFKKKDIRVMNRLAEAALKLNGVPTRLDAKNGSGETISVVSPIVSQPPAAS
jgi:hypothetical protein